MGPLERLRARLFNDSKEPACIFPAILHTTKAIMDRSKIRTQQHPLCNCMRHCSSSMKANGMHLMQWSSKASTDYQPLVWSEARRTRSAPTPTPSRGASDTGEPSKETDRDSEETESEDDDVFFEPSDCGFLADEECYSEVVTLQRLHGWVWSITLPEEVCMAWEEWSVPPGEILTLEGEPKTVSSTELVYSGYWHGRVSLRARGARHCNDLVSFLEEVHILSCIRHHNIQLFMGAAVQPSSRQPLILIMGEVKGQSLHTRLHYYAHSFTHPSKQRILVQIAQAMSYLHSREIPHTLLTSAHVTLTHSCRVCLSLPPHLPPPHTYHPSQLVYLPPEYIRTLRITTRPVSMPMRVVQGCLWRDRGRQDPFLADIYAFGTIVYELSTVELPFCRVPMETLILRVGCGETEGLGLIKHRVLRSIALACWEHSPQHRPSFRQLANTLEANVAISTTTLTRSVSLPTSLVS